MTWYKLLLVIIIVFVGVVLSKTGCCGSSELGRYEGGFRIFPSAPWNLHHRQPMTTNGNFFTYYVIYLSIFIIITVFFLPFLIKKKINNWGCNFLIFTISVFNQINCRNLNWGLDTNWYFVILHSASWYIEIPSFEL